MAVTSGIKLRVYNGALFHLGSRKLSSLSEAREPRRVLDEVWGSNDEVIYWALEQGEWNFAIRSVQADYSASVTPSFGFRRAFDKPSDFRRLAQLSSDEYFTYAMTDREFKDEATYWFTDHDVLYIRYVSDSDEYGLNSAAWSEAFIDFLEFRLAWKACRRITNSNSTFDRIDRDYQKALRAARSFDAMNEGVKILPSGSWVRARAQPRRYN